jgi:hypothetical protein
VPVTSLDALLAARAAVDGHARRTALFRHRHFAEHAAVTIPFQIGGESFAVGAIAWGTSRDRMNLAVVHDPRNRQEFYDEVVPFAVWLGEYFGRLSSGRDSRTKRDGRIVTTCLRAPQLVVPNAASAELLGRLGRRLAFLGASPFTIHPSLVPAGRHLHFLRDQLRVPGQQLVVPLAQVLADHWATPQTNGERMSLPALFAWVDPPPGVHGYLAAEEAEVDVSVGPIPPGAHDEELYDLLDKRRDLAKNGHSVARVDQEVEALWGRLITPAWDLCWKVLDEEHGWPAAATARRRWLEDREAYTRHIDWHRTAGHRRVRKTPRQAARMHSELERALARLTAEEAIDDPLRLVPYVLRDEAIIGEVVRVDTSNRELTARGQRRTFPLVSLSCAHYCRMPLGKELWWGQDATAQYGWIVREITPTSGDRSTCTVTLRRVSSSDSRTTLPGVATTASFSELKISTFQPLFPKETNMPWTHRRQAGSDPTTLEPTGGSSELEPPTAPLGDPRDRERDD